MPIQKPSKLALTETGPWKLQWRKSHRFQYEEPAVIFHDRERMLAFVKEKILACRQEGHPSRLQDFHATKPNRLASVVLGLLREWDAQFRPEPRPVKPHQRPTLKVQRRVKNTLEDMAYLHGVFVALERLSLQIRNPVSVKP